MAFVYVRESIVCACVGKTDECVNSSDFLCPSQLEAFGLIKALSVCMCASGIPHVVGTSICLHAYVMGTKSKSP